LQAVCASVLSTQDYCPTAFTDRIDLIEVPEDNHLRFVFKEGSIDERTWADRSRRDSWTEEMKQAARERRKNQCQEQ
jgi:site-specific DNA recombinase